MINNKLGDIRGERPKTKNEAKNETSASNCKGCGAVLEPNISFCGSCGLPAGGPK